LLAVVGGMVAGLVLGWATLNMMKRIAHIPTAIILQFVCTFGVWIVADRLGLSAVLTIVCFGLTMARTGPRSIPAHTRIATNVVWGTAVFALNILAFIFIGLQIRPIIEDTAAADRPHYFMVSAAVLASAIVVRLVWHMLFNGVTRWRHHRSGFNPPRPLLRPSVGTGLVISWSGMRGIVTLAAALALPADFPYRGLVVLCAAVVVLGTLVIQGLSLKPLLRMLDLHDDDPVGREEKAAYAGALAAALASIDGDSSAAADAVRNRLHAQFDVEDSTDANASKASGDQRSIRIELYGKALRAARDAVLVMRSEEDIGDDAFHRIEQRLDWIEMARPN
jgi:CPA1 family monovalent cation:H+ antiporter